MSIVIDSSALIAFVKREPGAARVGGLLDGGLVSSVIFAESLSKMAVMGYDAEAARRDFLDAGLRVDDFTLSSVGSVVALHPLSRMRVSFADRVCLALAMTRKLPVLTGDRQWVGLGLPLEFELIR